MAIIPMKDTNTGDIVYRPDHFLELFPKQLSKLPSQRAAEKNDTKKETK